MTENETKAILTSLKEDNNWGGSIPEVFDIAIKSLEEIQQYRAIGTVEDWNKLIKKEATERRKLEEYFMFGSVEEFQALKEKSVAKKPILNNPQINEFFVKEAKLCPSCHSYINNCSGNYCRDCGQAIDWSE